MMKNVIRLLCLLMALLLSLPLALAETEDPVIATVNGEPLYYSEYAPIESAYLYQYQMAGVDLTDPEVCAYVQDQALSYAIEQKLIEQDMAAQGCYELTEDLEIWCQEMGQLAWEEALDDVCEMFRDTLELTEDEDLTEYALAYAANDLVLIVLWVIAALADIANVPMAACFVMFFANDMYGFINWRRMAKRQESGENA